MNDGWGAQKHYPLGSISALLNILVYTMIDMTWDDLPRWANHIMLRSEHLQMTRKHWLRMISQSLSRYQSPHFLGEFSTQPAAKNCTGGSPPVHLQLQVFIQQDPAKMPQFALRNNRP